MTKTITIGLVAIAFVAGSILTGTMAYAAGDKNGKPFEALWDAIHDLQIQIDAIPAGPPGPPGADADPAGIFVAQVASNGIVYGRGTPNTTVQVNGPGNYEVTFTDVQTSGINSGLCNAQASPTFGSGQSAASMIDSDFTIIAAASHLGGGKVNVVTVDASGGNTVNKNFVVILACSSS